MNILDYIDLSGFEKEFPEEDCKMVVVDDLENTFRESNNWYLCVMLETGFNSVELKIMKPYWFYEGEKVYGWEDDSGNPWEHTSKFREVIANRKVA